MEKWIAFIIWSLPLELSAQVEHWSFEAICTGMEAPFFKDVYTAPGHYRIRAIAGGSSTDLIADSLQGRVLALFNDEGNRSLYFYHTCPDSVDYFTPTDIVDFENAQIAVNPSGETKTVFGLTLLHIDLYLGGKPIGEAWVAEGVVVPGSYTFALPDGRWVTVLELTYAVRDFRASKRFTAYEVLEPENGKIFPMDIPEGYGPPKRPSGE